MKKEFKAVKQPSGVKVSESGTQTEKLEALENYDKLAKKQLL